MTSTNGLAPVDLADLSGADLLRLWSQKYGGDTRLSLSVLADFVAAQSVGKANTLSTQYEAPTATGFSVTVLDGDTWLVLTPAAGYAAGTVVLPVGADKEEVLVVCSQSVGTLTVTPASGESVVGQPASLSANGFFRLRFDGVLSRWYRVG